MKPLLIIILSLSYLTGCSQSNVTKIKVEPKIQYRDTVYIQETIKDSLDGFIKYFNQDGKEVTTRGYRLNIQVWQMQGTRPAPPTQWMIKGKDTIGFGMSGDSGWLQREYQKYFAIINGKSHEIDSRKQFTFYGAQKF